MRVTIVFITGREEPCLNWAVEDLDKQLQQGDDIQLIVIDTFNRSPSDLGVSSRARVQISVSPPKPNIWQGPSRVTSVDWWANSNARNTGIALCKTDYIVFLDDRCHLGPGWLDAVRRGEHRRRSVIVGAYEKHENGKVTPDHRLVHRPQGLRDCGGGWLYGCTFALPLAWCLECNGFEEGCDGLSGEDYVFGLMLGNNGHRIDFVPSMFVSLERSLPHANKFIRSDKGVSPNDKSHAALARFRTRKRTEFTADLTALRDQLSRGGRFPVPDPKVVYRDWYDGIPIKEAGASTTTVAATTAPSMKNVSGDGSKS